MKIITYIITILAFLCISGCLFITNFYVNNNTYSDIEVEIKIKSTRNQIFAVLDTVYFYNITSEPKRGNIELIEKRKNAIVHSQKLDSAKIMSFKISPKSAVKTDGGAHNSFFYSLENRKSLFKNIINMRIISTRLKDAINLSEYHLASFSK